VAQNGDGRVNNNEHINTITKTRGTLEIYSSVYNLTLCLPLNFADHGKQKTKWLIQNNIIRVQFIFG